MLAFSMLCVLPQIGRAGGDGTTAIIDKAIKAHFPKGVDTKNRGLRTKGKGMLHVMGLDLEFVQEVSIQMPNKFKEAMEITVKDMKINTIAVFDGKKGWIKAADKDVPVTKEILAEFKEAVHGMSLALGMFEKAKDIKYAALGEVQIKGKPALGVKVSKEGKKDIDFYFDKATGLIRKVELRKRDFMSGQEVTEERFITEYQDVEGRKVAKKVQILRDGKDFLELEVMDVQFLERIDDSEFGKPQ
jgi:hypothetical protein